MGSKKRPSSRLHVSSLNHGSTNNHSVTDSPSPSTWGSRSSFNTSSGKLTTDSKSSVATLTHSLSFTLLIVALTLFTVAFVPKLKSALPLYEYLEHFFESDPIHGGWRPATEEVLKKYNTDICNIQRLSVHVLRPERFEEDFRFKKPLLVTFPNGAKDWTDPYLWSRKGLLDAYKNWTIHFGQSLEIVRAGGNARFKTTFEEFVDKLLEETNKTTNEPLHYGFDRRFYYETKLPDSLRLPSYFQTKPAEDDSIFFLGSSMTGVVFHKHSDTWNGVVYGKKRWFLYPASKTPPGGVYHGFSLLDWYHNIYANLDDSDKPTECVQESGEILYLPEGFYHATLNLGDTIAVAIQKKNATIESERLSYEATKFNNLMAETNDEKVQKEINLQLRDIYEKTLEILPENAEAHHKLGLALFNLELYHDALQMFMKAIKLDRYFVLSYIHMAKSLSKLRDYQKADIVFKKAIEVSPNLWDNYKEYGEFLLQQGRPGHAIHIYKKGTELMPDMLPFWHYYKYCQQQLGDIEGAEQTEKIMTELKQKQQSKNS